MEKNLFGKVLYKLDNKIFINLAQITSITENHSHVLKFNGKSITYLIKMSNRVDNYEVSVSTGEDILRAMAKL